MYLNIANAYNKCTHITNGISIDWLNMKCSISKYPFQYSTMADRHDDTSHRMVNGYYSKLAVLEMPISHSCYDSTTNHMRFYGFLRSNLHFITWKSGGKKFFIYKFYSNLLFLEISVLKLKYIKNKIYLVLLKR